MNDELYSADLEKAMKRSPYIASVDKQYTLAMLRSELASEKERGKLAFILGNGINRYASVDSAISWDKLIELVWEDASLGEPMPKNLNGLPLTEIYDLLCLKLSASTDKWEDKVQKIRKKVVGFIGNTQYITKLQQRLSQLQVPVLTTNYDANLEEGLKQFIIKNFELYQSAGYSETYPLSEYYAKNEIAESDFQKSFSVWHINGRINHPKSIRLGSADYMGLMAYTKNILQKEANLFNVRQEGDAWGIEDLTDKTVNKKYRYTWLNILYNSSLCINGLMLDPNETYLRWLLLSRKKYLDRIGMKAYGWYICSHNDLTNGKEYFIKNVGFNIIIIDDLNVRYNELFDF